MFKIKSAARLALTVGLIVACSIYAAIMLGLAPDPARMAIKRRVDLSELVAMNAARLAENNRLADLSTILDQMIAANHELQSIGIRKRDGDYRLTFGPHIGSWKDGETNPQQLKVDVKSGDQAWATIELRFKPLQSGLLSGALGFPLGLLLFAFSVSSLLSWFTFIRTFRYLDPAKVVPNRVRSALDSLAEGLVLIDNDSRIVHANQVFSKMIGRGVDELIGTIISELPWLDSVGAALTDSPWEFSLKQKQPVTGRIMQLSHRGEQCKYNVNTNPISSPNGDLRGVLVSFDDVTLLERKKQDLAGMVESLRKSRDEIQVQNVKLLFLASRDPLTKCINRRTFWEMFDQAWQETNRNHLSVLMVDIDHFKTINDDHGHSKGDAVLREVGAMLLHLIGNEGVVCRYGGEEFAVLLTTLDLDRATHVGEAILRGFRQCQLGGLKVTASVGLSNRQLGAMDGQHLLDQADQCLYAAKRNGRNRMIRFDQIAELDRDPNRTKASKTRPAKQISYNSAMALFTALTFHNRRAAYVSQRVADICVLIGRNQIDPRTLYWLEISGLLRLVGCLGDATRNDLIGKANFESHESRQLSKLTIDMLRATFASEELVWIIAGRGEANMADADAQAFETRLDLCHRILNTAVELVEQSENGRRITLQTIRTEIANHDITADETTCKQILAIISHSTTLLTDAISRQIPSGQNASLLGPFVDEICTSIADRDLTRIKEVIADLRLVANTESSGKLQDIVDSLNIALEKRDPEFEKLSQLADQIMELCRSTRKSLVRSTRPQPLALNARESNQIS